MAYYLGVDQGTTYSAAAICRQGRVEIAALGGRDSDIPSIVFLREDETILVGEAARRRGLSEPSRMVREFKRRFGDPTPFLLGGSPIAADALWAKLLRWVLDTVEKAEGGRPDGVTITHPANWGPYKLDLLAQAIRLADVPNPLTLTEPEAAAISYAGSNRVDEGEVVGVYDLGGGTFDAAILRRTPAGFELIGRPEGIERLGGIDVDEAVFAHVKGVMGDALAGLDPEDAAAISAVARLRQECVVAKEVLSQDTEVTIPVLLPGLTKEVRLTRSELETMIRPTLSPTVEALGRAVASAGLEPKDLSAVLLVGGSSRIPLVGQMVGASLQVPVVTDAHPKHGVASGAALYAEGTAARTGPAATPSRLVRLEKPVSGATLKSPAAPPPPPATLPAPAAPKATSPPPIGKSGSEKGPFLPTVLPKWAWQTVALALVGALIIGVMAYRRGSNPQIVLVPAGSPGADAFVDNESSEVLPVEDGDAEIIVSAASGSSGAVAAPRLGASVVQPQGIASFRGGTPGLFGGAREKRICQADAIRQSLNGESDALNSFADGTGVAVGDLPAFFGRLTEVVLRGDTRVTIYRYSDGKAEGEQAVLEAGTTVLVDQFGVPRVRCLSGSPLKPPVSTRSTDYTDDSWDSGRSVSVSAIAESTTPIETFVLVDLATGSGVFNRAAGEDGSDSDFDGGGGA